jgi:hypothetical protein
MLQQKILASFHVRCPNQTLGDPDPTPSHSAKVHVLTPVNHHLPEVFRFKQLQSGKQLCLPD